MNHLVMIFGKAAAKASNFTNRNAPTILAIFGAAGVIATAVLAVQATPKAEELIFEAQEEKFEKLTKLEIVKAAWKPYIPTALMAGTAILCIFGCHTLHLKREAALLSALSLTEAALSEYKDEVKKELGEDRFRQLQEAIHEKHVAALPPGTNVIDTQSGDILFFESTSRRWFRASMDYVLQAEYHINRNFTLGKTIVLNDWYDFLGLPHTTYGDILGWESYSGEALYGYIWIDFWHREKTLPDGTPYISIEYPFEPHNFIKDIKELTP